MSKMKGRIFMRRSGPNAGMCLKIQWIGSTTKWNFPLSFFVNSERFQEVIPVKNLKGEKENE